MIKELLILRAPTRAVQHPTIEKEGKSSSSGTFVDPKAVYFLFSQSFSSRNKISVQPSIMSRSIGDANDDTGRSTARLLRIISLWTFIPALAFNIAHGVRYNCVFPAVGLVPHTFSVALAVHELGWWRQLFGKSQYSILLEGGPERDGSSSLRNVAITVLDTVFGLSLTGCIVGAYIEMSARAGSYYYNDVGLTIVGTYATLPYILNA
jgi:hypothetical protein